MFKKPHDVGLSRKHALGGKDVKKFKNDVIKKYPLLQDELWSELFPDKTVWFLKLNSGTLVWKNADENPIFFDPSGHLDLLIPTIYSLTIVPDLIPSVMTNSVVSESMLRGADLFLQGMSGTDFLKDQIRAVKIPGNPVPFVVGKMALSYQQALKNRMEGRGLISLHYYGDQLFKMGDEAVPNDGFSTARISTCLPVGDENKSEDDVVAKLVSEVSITDGSIPEDTKGEEIQGQGGDWNNVIWSCALGALHSMKKSELPISVNEFFSAKMVPLKPPEVVSLDMKKSKWKKVSKLLDDLADEGLVVIKNVRKESCICEIEKSHSAIRDWRPESLGGRKPGGFRNDSPHIQTIQYMYKSPQIFADLLNLENKNQLVDSNHIEGKLKEYIIGYGGMSGDETALVGVDGFLAGSLFGKKEQPAIEDMIPFEEIKTRFYAKLQKWHCIEKMEKDGTLNQIINKGEPSNICLTALKRSGRVYTVVTGMENFGYEPKTLSDTLQKRMKTACFVADLPGKSNKKEVVMQGDWIAKRSGSHYLPSYFTEEGIPTTCLTIINNIKKK